MTKTMKQPITGFRLDDEGDWIAILSCGHPQHVRHSPPFINRPWIVAQQGRDLMIGKHLNCVRCERFEIPSGFTLYKQTPVLTEVSMPATLRKHHSTKAGVWAKIVVIEGRLRYKIRALEEDVELTQGSYGIVVPEVTHRVEPLSKVRFLVEFYKAPIGLPRSLVKLFPR
jgi:tellurite methyltransferase